MITKEQVLQKIDEYLAYSNAQQPSYSSYYSALIAPLTAAVNAYFASPDSELKGALEDYIFQQWCDINQRNTSYEGLSFTYPTDYPAGYNDATECFYKFDWASKEAFYSAWVLETEQGTGEGTATSITKPVSNTLIDQYVAELKTAPKDDVNRVKDVSSWCADAASSNSLQLLLNDVTNYDQSMTSQQIGKIIYNDHNIKEVINAKGLQIYMPDYL